MYYILRQLVAFNVCFKYFIVIADVLDNYCFETRILRSNSSKICPADD